MAYSIEDVQKLAALARLSIPEDRLPKLATEFDAILGYVSQLEELVVDERLPLYSYTNIFRPDENPHATGEFTEKVAEQFPAREGDYLSVKQIISHD